LPDAETHDRAYMQARLHEEIARARRYSRRFAILLFEAVPSVDGLPVRRKVEYALTAINATVRPSDVVARVFEDTVMVLLVEADARGARDALIRIRNRVARQAGNWQVTTYTFPEHEQAIEELPVLAAA
jgi:GGDEF domain-containing protein